MALSVYFAYSSSDLCYAFSLTHFVYLLRCCFSKALRCITMLVMYFLFSSALQKKNFKKKENISNKQTNKKRQTWPVVWTWRQDTWQTLTTWHFLFKTVTFLGLSLWWPDGTGPAGVGGPTDRGMQSGCRDVRVGRRNEASSKELAKHLEIACSAAGGTLAMLHKAVPTNSCCDIFPLAFSGLTLRGNLDGWFPWPH